MIKIRDLIVGMAALAVMITTLFVFSDRLRQSTLQMSGSVGDIRSNGTVVNFADAAIGVAHALRDFGADNPFLAVFLVVAIVLVLLAMKL